MTDRSDKCEERQRDRHDQDESVEGRHGKSDLRNELQREKREERREKREERREEREERRAKREEKKREERRKKREETPKEAAKDPQMRPPEGGQPFYWPCRPLLGPLAASEQREESREKREERREKRENVFLLFFVKCGRGVTQGSL